MYSYEINENRAIREEGRGAIPPVLDTLRGIVRLTRQLNYSLRLIRPVLKLAVLGLEVLVSFDFGPRVLFVLARACPAPLLPLPASGNYSALSPHSSDIVPDSQTPEPSLRTLDIPDIVPDCQPEAGEVPWLTVEDEVKESGRSKRASARQATAKVTQSYHNYPSSNSSNSQTPSPEAVTWRRSLRKTGKTLGGSSRRMMEKTTILAILAFFRSVACDVLCFVGARLYHVRTEAQDLQQPFCPSLRPHIKL